MSMRLCLSFERLTAGSDALDLASTLDPPPPSPNREISDRRIRGSPMSCAAGEAGVEAAAGLDCANGALC